MMRAQRALAPQEQAEPALRGNMSSLRTIWCGMYWRYILMGVCATKNVTSFAKNLAKKNKLALCRLLLSHTVIVYFQHHSFS
jgi:hypothetical protein